MAFATLILAASLLDRDAIEIRFQNVSKWQPIVSALSKRYLPQAVWCWNDGPEAPNGMIQVCGNQRCLEPIDATHADSAEAIGSAVGSLEDAALTPDSAATKRSKGLRT